MNEKTEFRKELETLINWHCMENGSNTPDFILADYINESLSLFDKTVERRELWYGRDRNKVDPILGDVKTGAVIASEGKDG